MTEYEGIWVLATIGHEGVRVEDSEITMEISGDQISGNAGVNRFFGKFEGGTVVAPIGTTMMAGPQALMEQERAFLDLIQRAHIWTVETGSLVVRARDTSAVFLPFVGTLVGVRWELAGYNNGTGGFTTPVPGTLVTAVFDDKGFVSGSAGCNTYRASYELADGTISIGPAMTTRMACLDEEIMKQELRYLQILERSVRLGFSRERGRDYVELYDGDELRLIRLVGSDPQGTEENL